MRAGEWIAVVYFLGVVCAALALRHRRAGWGRAALLAASGLGISLIARTLDAGLPVDLRSWVPLAVLPFAYWAPAPLAGEPSARVESWLRRIDGRLGLDHAPGSRSALQALELAYLLVYPLVPAGLVAVMASGDAAAAQRFWPALLCAVLPCYGLLPLIRTRPPRRLDEAGSRDIRTLNLRFMSAFGNGWNTLPSGHAAGAVAVAVLVARSGSPAAPAFAIAAAAIAIATVTGRYHYTVDTVLGVLLGWGAAALA